MFAVREKRRARAHYLALKVCHLDSPDRPSNPKANAAPPLRNGSLTRAIRLPGAVSSIAYGNITLAGRWSRRQMILAGWAVCLHIRNCWIGSRLNFEVG